MAVLDSRGAEILDTTPISLPIKFSRPEPLHLRIRRMVIAEMNALRTSDDFESFEEADDFEVGDDVPSFESNPTEYEQGFDNIPDIVRQMDKTPPVEASKEQVEASSSDAEKSESES